MPPSIRNLAGISSKPVLFVTFKDDNSLKTKSSLTGFNINLYLFGFLLLKKSKNTCDTTLKIPLI
jgi:hypothetical protein